MRASLHCGSGTEYFFRNILPIPVEFLFLIILKEEPSSGPVCTAQVKPDSPVKYFGHL